jgi:AcrR family transcriptional regulator
MTSAPRQGAAGLHLRAGNAMGRTREGLLDGALVSIARVGVRRTTMAGICDRSGVARATLYNHFRTKPELLAALVARQVERIATDASTARGAGGPGAALDRAAELVASLPAGRRVADIEPEVLLPLLVPSSSAGWRHARTTASDLLGVPVEHPLVDIVLMWLASQVLAPQDAVPRRATADLLAGALAPLTAGSSDTST